MIGKIKGTGLYIPAKYLDNNDLAKMVDTNDEWIRERTGIIRRHIVDEETTVSMAADAARKAMSESGVEAEDIDLIIVCTASSNVIFPSAACEVQKELGAVRATAFDVNAACSGFLYGYVMAQGFIASGIYENILVIGSESLSKLINWEDRGTCILFGDGAGAVLIKAQEGRNYLPVTHSDGSMGETLTCNNRHIKDFTEDHYIKMEGQAVFKFAVKKVPEVILEVLEKNSVEIEEIDWFILHQANKRIIESIAKRLHVDMDKFPVNVSEYGNTSAASIPILLAEMAQKNLLKEGQKIVMSGFGAGLTWGAAILEW